MNTSILVFQEEDLKLALQVEPLEEVIDHLNAEIKKRHIKRLRKGKCTIEWALSFRIFQLIMKEFPITVRTSRYVSCS